MSARSLGLRCLIHFSEVSIGLKECIVTVLIKKHVPLLSRKKLKIEKLPLKFLMVQ